MGWLPLYLVYEDVEFLNDWLNQEEEIAFLVSNGPSKWIAKKQHDIIADLQQQKLDGYIHGNYLNYRLWHIPSGPLPLFGSGNGKLRFHKEDWDENNIKDPWAGWTELQAGADSSVPYFGAGHPGIIRLKIHLSHDKKEIPMSDFQWIGNHYKIIGSAADKSTEKFWNRLRRMTKKIGTHIPRGNRQEGKNEIYAFPSAYKEIQEKRTCSTN